MKIISKLIVLVLPVLCSAKIIIKINVASKIERASVKFYGQDNKVVTDEDVKTFNITKENLNIGMRVELGKVPQDIFLKDPTPYENLYEYFEWPEIKRNMRIKKAKILEIINEKVTLATYEHINNTTDPIESRINFVDSTELTSFSTWSHYGLPVDEMFYDINLNVNHLKFKYENKWRSNNISSFDLSFGITKEELIKIKSGQLVTSELTALKTIFLVQMDYEAKIIGSFIADYDPLYGKYHFYAPTAANIMRAAKLKNYIKTTELIEIRCFLDPKLRIFDKTGEMVEIVSPASQVHNKKKVRKSKVFLFDGT